MQRARRLINRFGPFAVTLCFLTVGLQSAVIGSAGLARMPQRRFLPAVVLGSLIWAVVYATVGLAAAAAWIALLLESPAAAAVLAGIAVLAAAYVIWRRRRKPAAPAAVRMRVPEACLTTAALRQRSGPATETGRFGRSRLCGRAPRVGHEGPAVAAQPTLWACP